jgi:hypothetical protein
MLDLIQAKAAAPGTDGPDSTSIISFSDSVIRARPCAGDVVAALVYEIRELAVAQWELMNHRIFVRGGMTIGDVLMVPGRAFGPAFIRAYELETSWARSPRIVLDPRTVEHIREQARGTGLTGRRQLLTTIRESIAFDQDGLWFVDYIGAAYKRLGADEHWAVLSRQRDSIIASANTLRPESDVWAKYLWLIRYFNTSAAKLHKGKKGMKIQRSDVPFADDLLIPPPIAGVIASRQRSAATVKGKKR